MNVFDLSMADRETLLSYWAGHQIGCLVRDVCNPKQEYDESRQISTDIYDEFDRRVLETAEVIGVTTTGLAKRISVLRHVSVKVEICEEAGEVLEAHMLSALIPSAQHLIQIGDHQQLRPQINNHNLSLENPLGRIYQLDRSQFERLSVGERGRPPFPISQLNVQRRMRPDISALIRKTQYPRLEDHASVGELPNVIGMRNNIFWLDHKRTEESMRPDTVQKSKSNDWEVDMTHTLVRHIVRQGIYNSRDIAVLTPYTGQLQKLRAKMSHDFEIVLSEQDRDKLAKDGFTSEGIHTESKSKLSESGEAFLEKKTLNNLLRIATVDNFQGEEAKIVLVSLVRSNDRNRVGFLRTENRINVLLSRAQYGMYLIGNADTYANIPMWAAVLGMLRLQDSVGPAFALCCPRHPETEIQVAQPEEFATHSPEGGCRLACDRRLDACGHRCMAKCHSETMHRIFSCPHLC